MCKASQTAILLFCISFSWGWSWSLPPVQCHKLLSIVLQALYQIRYQHIGTGCGQKLKKKKDSKACHDHHKHMKANPVESKDQVRQAMVWILPLYSQGNLVMRGLFIHKSLWTMEIHSSNSNWMCFQLSFFLAWSPKCCWFSKALDWRGHEARGRELE